MKRPSFSIRGALRPASSAWVGIVIGPSATTLFLRSPDRARGRCLRTGPDCLLVEPERVEAHYVVDAEVLLRIVALHVVVPAVVDLLPGDRQERRVLLHDRLGLADQLEPLLGIDLTVDLGQERVELGIVPLRVVLRPALLVPGVE